MATGVVIARGLVSELVDCHARDTVSAMSYRDRSEAPLGHAFAQRIRCAIELLIEVVVLFVNSPSAFIVIVTVPLDITFDPSCVPADIVGVPSMFIGNTFFIEFLVAF